MATSSVSSASGGTLDVPSLVSQLMVIENQPLNTLNNKVSTDQTKISSLGTIKGLVSSFQTSLQSLTSSLQGYSATPSDASVFSATASSSAAAGTYSLNITTLAQAQRLAAAGQASDTSPISTGASTVTFTVGGTSTNISIAAGASLQDIRTAINGANMGVTATIVNDGSGTPYRLALSANTTGTSSAISSITIQSGGDVAVNNLLAFNPTVNAPSPTVPMAETIPAANADFTVNGIRMIKSSNTVTDAIQGVTLTLNKNTTGNLTVARDTNAVSTALSSFVTAYNAMAVQLKTSSAYGSSTQAASALAGDGTLRLMLDQLGSIFTSPATPASGGSLTSLSQIGISHNTDGTLALDSSKLNSAIANNYSDVANLFSSSTGFATRMDAWATNAAGVGGLIEQHTNNLNTSITGYNNQISQLQVRLTKLQQEYTTTYTNLNSMLISMNATSTYLTAQFATK